ncbi:hypothetical protein [Rhodococcus koreensis]|uniref:hypothetical protein n=1 Tax=Rhodococcus koreensis TaxID=99653 RepID=UPI0036D99133
MSKQAKKSMARTIRIWQLGRWTALSFQAIAAMIHPAVAGDQLLRALLQVRVDPGFSSSGSTRFW